MGIGHSVGGEAVAGDGSEGIQAVFEARHRAGSAMAFTAFDLLELDGASVMGEAWMTRRKRLEDLLEAPPPGVCLVPVTDDAPALWDAWVGQGGEGIVLKERASLYRPGVRSPAWLKLKPKLSLEVVVRGGSAERVRWSNWGEAVMLAFRYTHPRTGAAVEIRQAVETLSGGQRQGVAVARSAAFARHVVILDEPTAALGVKEGNMVLELIRRVRDRGLPVILISHNMPHVF